MIRRCRNCGNNRVHRITDPLVGVRFHRFCDYHFRKYFAEIGNPGTFQGLFCSHWKPNDYMRMYGVKAYKRWLRSPGLSEEKQ
jgi:hypothetical protein